MKMNAKYELPFKRRLENKTDYMKRLKLLKSRKPRLVIRKSLNHIRAQLFEFTPRGDKTLAAASSQDLQKLGWNSGTRNIPSAYLVGLMIGKRALKNKINGAILDTGLYPNIKGSRINSVLKGVADAGLSVKYSEDVLPSEDRIRGKHIVEYCKKFGGKHHLFSKNNPEKLEDVFLKIKSMILKGETNEERGEKKVRRKGESK